jgi:2,3-bisphosphoglycerate-dependent phosphoglycerate mutase
MELEIDEDMKYLQRHGIHFLYDRLVENIATVRPSNVIDFLITSLQKEQDACHKLVLVRHGESTWNKENVFTGWDDCDLSANGLEEANSCGDLLKAGGYEFDCAYTSMLKRSIRTLWITLDNLDLMFIPVVNHWRLNARHYGALQRANKTETARKRGMEQVKQWRRSTKVQPPLIDRTDERFPGNDRRYNDIPSQLLPLGESLVETMARILPLWLEEISPLIKENKRVLIVAHGNTLRALIMYLDHLSETATMGLDIPTGIPLVYELNGDLKPIRHYYLETDEEVQKRTEAVITVPKH